MKSYITNLLKLILKYFPYGLKKKLNTFYKPDMSQSSIFEKYISTNSPTCLLFNSGEKRPGCLTVGYEARCDIKIGKSEHTRLNIPNKSLDIIEINLFLETIEGDDYFWEFFREIGRLIKDSGSIKIIFLDLEEIIDKKCLTEDFWNLRKRFLYSKRASLFNSSISYIKNCRRIVDFETLEKITDLLGFNLVSKSYDNKSIIKEIVIVKNISKSDQWKLTNTLPQKEEIAKDVPIYLFSCDSSLILDNFSNIDLEKLQGRKFVSVIGSLFFMNLIPILKPKEIVLFDINPLQVRYMKLIVEVIHASKDFKGFQENIFSRRFNINAEKFLSQQKDQKILNNIRKNVEDKEIYDLTLGKIAMGKYIKLNNMVPAIKIEENSMCLHISVSDKEYFKPGPRINVFNTSFNLRNNFKYIKSKLIKAEILEAKLEDKRILNILNSDSLIYVSNIGEEDWINGNHADYTNKEFEDITTKYNLTKSFKKQWLESVRGFKKFISDINNNYWIVDSSGNIFTKNEILLERSDSHEWLWGKLKSEIIGTSIEVIHKQKGTWGFKEHLKTINYKKYINSSVKPDTIILHILLGNRISKEDFIKVLSLASKSAKRIIILEHDRDSENFGELSDLNIIDIRSLLKIVRSIGLLKKAKICVEWTGASNRIDRKLYDNSKNYNRNIIITLDL